MSIRAIKLKTGEEIVADIDGVSKVGDKEVLSDVIILNKPMTIHMIPSEQGIGLQLMPWCIYLKEHCVSYPSEEVCFCEEPSTGIRNQYAEMIGLPVIPDNTIITNEEVPNLKLN